MGGHYMFGITASMLLAAVEFYLAAVVDLTVAAAVGMSIPKACSRIVAAARVSAAMGILKCLTKQ